MTLSELQTARTALLKAITNNKLQASFNGRSVTYRSMAELKDALSLIDGEIAKLSSSTGSSFTLASFRKSS